MGQLFGQGGLTTPNSAMIDPSSGQATAMGTPNQMMLKAGQQLKDTQNANAASDIAGNPQMPAQVSHLGTPSFSDAARLGAPPGGANALSPGLNKAGKLATLLTSGLQGAMAGRAKSEETVAATGGRRSGGAGMGFEAGYQLPWQRAGMQQQYEQEQAKTRLLQQQGDVIQTPGGPMPLALAKVFYPAEIRARAAENVQGQKSKTAESIQGQKSETSVDVANINQGIGIPVDQSTARLAGFPELAGKSVGKGTWGNINKALSAKGYHTQDMGQNGTGENQGMWLMDKAGERISQVSPTSLTYQRSANYAQLRPVQVADPNSPGNTKYEAAGTAIAQGAAGPQSASVQVPKAMAKSATSGPIGTQITAFNTALQHADLLQQALGALNNGDVRVLNSLKNKFKTEFGSADVTNLQAITNAYSREITKMLSAGHMTDAEIGSSGATMPTNASPQQMLGALQAYRTLATSKMQQLQGQVKAGMQGKPNFPADLGLSNFHINPQTGERIGWDGKKWQTAPAQQQQ